MYQNLVLKSLRFVLFGANMTHGLDPNRTSIEARIKDPLKSNRPMSIYILLAEVPASLDTLQSLGKLSVFSAVSTPRAELSGADDVKPS